MEKIGHKYHFGVYEKLIIYLLYWSILQDFVLPLIYKLSGSLLLTNILFYQKDIIFFILLIWCLSKKQNKDIFVISVAFALVIGTGVIHGFINGASISAIVSDARGLIILPGFLLIGYRIKNEDFKEFLVNRYIPFLVFCALFGLFDYVLDLATGTKEFWTNGIGLTRYLIDIKHIDESSNSIIMGLPGNFYGYGSNGEFYAAKRVVSFWANPLGAGYVLIIPSVYYFFNLIYFKKRDKKTIILTLICFVAVFLTKTRAILLGFGVAIFIFAITKLEKRAYIIVTGIFGVIILMMRKGINAFISFFVDGSTMGHLAHLLNPRYLFNFFGNGVGMSGNQVESVFLTIISHIGWIGLILYVILYCTVMIKTYKNRYICDLSLMVAYVTIIYFVGGVFSAMLLRYTTVVPLFIMLGYSQNLKKSYTITTSIRVVRSINKGFDDESRTVLLETISRF
ncbi:MAG: hypothetical protein K6G45_06165 [Lachnospiraceae bacterium]|nr:hypothetical protein [Lachnospiraceae bacterium]